MSARDDYPYDLPYNDSRADQRERMLDEIDRLRRMVSIDEWTDGGGEPAQAVGRDRAEVTVSNVLAHNIARVCREQAIRLRLMANQLNDEADKLDRRADLIKNTNGRDGVSTEEAK